ncbi:VOC family protein, partial [Bacillus mycoides]|uniref:VOC family protein n=1 Tax=Bacillus mycoides TaxID=1405 RepID=UPI0011A1DF6A
IEFLGVRNEEKGKEAHNGVVLESVERLEKGEGMVEIAVGRNGIEELGRKVVEKGLEVKGGLEGKGMRKEGHVMEWKMLFVEQEENGG